MTFLRLAWGLVLVCLSLAVLPFAGARHGDTKAKDAIVIIIDDEMKYIKEGDKEQKPVVVKVGQTVIWKNTDPADSHTATSNDKKDGKPLFDTDKIEAGKSAKVVFDQKLFESAGGKAGGEVKLEYRCIYHKDGKSSIILKSADSR